MILARPLGIEFEGGVSQVNTRGWERRGVIGEVASSSGKPSAKRPEGRPTGGQLGAQIAIGRAKVKSQDLTALFPRCSGSCVKHGSEQEAKPKRKQRKTREEGDE